MIKIFSKIIKNKYFIIWFLLFVLLIYYLFGIFIPSLQNIMEEEEITNNLFIYNNIMLPMTFYENNFTISVILDISYLAITSYIVIKFIDYFFNETSSSTLTRISRSKWIKNIIIINLIFSIFISLFYIIFYTILCLCNNIELSFNYLYLIPLIYKIIITIIIPIIYLYIYIKTDSPFISLLFFIIIYILFEFIISITYSSEILSFKFIPIIIIFFIVVYVLVIKLIFNSIERRDI